MQRDVVVIDGGTTGGQQTSGKPCSGILDEITEDRYGEMKRKAVGRALGHRAPAL